MDFVGENELRTFQENGRRHGTDFPAEVGKAFKRSGFYDSIGLLSDVGRGLDTVFSMGDSIVKSGADIALTFLFMACPSGLISTFWVLFATFRPPFATFRCNFAT